VLKKLLALLIAAGVLGLTTGCPPDTTQTRDRARAKGGKEAAKIKNKAPDRTRDAEVGDGEKKDRDSE